MFVAKKNVIDFNILKVNEFADSVLSYCKFNFGTFSFISHLPDPQEVMEHRVIELHQQTYSTLSCSRAYMKFSCQMPL